MDIVEDEEGNIVRIQADMPKQLRDDVRVLYRVAKAAALIPDFQSAVVRGYALFLNGREYSPRELESLPVPIRPSTLASRASEKAMVFFSRHSVLSNHFPSKFKFKGIQFGNVEQYLAYKRALATDHTPTIQRALSATNPSEAKSILNALKDDHMGEQETPLDHGSPAGQIPPKPRTIRVTPKHFK